MTASRTATALYSTYRQAPRQPLAWLAGGLLLVLVIFALAVPVPAHAITTLSQGYATTDKLSLGSIVSLRNNTTDHVDAATTANIDGLLGVAVSDGNSLLSLSNGQTTQIQVATSGVAQVLVSDINGDVKDGDQVTASPLSGIGMKATASVKVIGIAQDDLNAANSSQQTYTDKAGQKHDVRIGQIPVLVNVSYYYKQPDKTVIPSAIQNVANALAGKQARPVPILICLGIFIATLVTVASIIYSMIRSSIISVGRNPMSQSAIYRNLVQMSVLVLIILGVSTLAMYMILTRF